MLTPLFTCILINVIFASVLLTWVGIREIWWHIALNATFLLVSSWINSSHPGQKAQGIRPGTVNKDLKSVFSWEHKYNNRIIVNIDADRYLTSVSNNDRWLISNTFAYAICPNQFVAQYLSFDVTFLNAIHVMFGDMQPLKYTNCINVRQCMEDRGICAGGIKWLHLGELIFKF